MTSWHEASCIRPDVELVDGSNPFCMSCGAIVPNDDTEPDRTPPPTIPFVEQWELSLEWPSSVDYSTTLPGGDGESVEDVVAAVQDGLRASDAVIDRSWTPDSDRTMDDIAELDVQNPAAGSSRFLDDLSGTDSIRVLRLSKGIDPQPLHVGDFRHHSFPLMAMSWESQDMFLLLLIYSKQAYTNTETS